MEWIAEHRGSARREQLGGFHQRRAVAQRTRGRLPPYRSGGWTNLTPIVRPFRQTTSQRWRTTA